jgi:hypothetical protein
MMPSVPRARWGPLHLQNHADYINGLRAIEPHLAIYVRTHAMAERLADLLVEDIQVGPLETPFERRLHSEVAHFRLPPIDPHWNGQ